MKQGSQAGGFVACDKQLLPPPSSMTLTNLSGSTSPKNADSCSDRTKTEVIAMLSITAFPRFPLVMCTITSLRGHPSTAADWMWYANCWPSTIAFPTTPNLPDLVCFVQPRFDDGPRQKMLAHSALPPDGLTLRQDNFLGANLHHPQRARPTRR